MKRTIPNPPPLSGISRTPTPPETAQVGGVRPRRRNQPARQTSDVGEMNPVKLAVSTDQATANMRPSPSQSAAPLQPQRRRTSLDPVITAAQVSMRSSDSDSDSSTSSGSSVCLMYAALNAMGHVRQPSALSPHGVSALPEANSSPASTASFLRPTNEGLTLTTSNQANSTTTTTSTGWNGALQGRVSRNGITSAGQVQTTSSPLVLPSGTLAAAGAYGPGETRRRPSQADTWHARSGSASSVGPNSSAASGGVRPLVDTNSPTSDAVMAHRRLVRHAVSSNALSSAAQESGGNATMSAHATVHHQNIKSNNNGGSSRRSDDISGEDDAGSADADAGMVVMPLRFNSPQRLNEFQRAAPTQLLSRQPPASYTPSASSSRGQSGVRAAGSGGNGVNVAEATHVSGRLRSMQTNGIDGHDRGAAPYISPVPARTSESTLSRHGAEGVFVTAGGAAASMSANSGSRLSSPFCFVNVPHNGTPTSTAAGETSSRMGTSGVGLRTPRFTDPSGAMPPRSLDFKRGRTIGSGGFGTVFLAILPEGTPVAVKELQLQSGNSSAIDREVYAMSRLPPHPNCVRYFGSRHSAHHYYIIMEYISSGSIQSLRRTYGVFKEPTFQRYAYMVLQGLEHLHRNNIIHRDIKGANVLIDERGCAKIVDFGCCRDLTQASVTQGTGGTPLWMAPEVCRGEPATVKSDVWSFGCLCLEMVNDSGLPWNFPPGTNIQGIAYAIANAAQPPPIPAWLSPLAQDFIACCLQLSPEARASVDELLAHPFFEVDLFDDADGSDDDELIASCQTSAKPSLIRSQRGVPANNDGANGLGHQDSIALAQLANVKLPHSHSPHEEGEEGGNVLVLRRGSQWTHEMNVNVHDCLSPEMSALQMGQVGTGMAPKMDRLEKAAQTVETSAEADFHSNSDEEEEEDEEGSSEAGLQLYESDDVDDNELIQDIIHNARHRAEINGELALQRRPLRSCAGSSSTSASASSSSAQTSSSASWTSSSQASGPVDRAATPGGSRHRESRAKRGAKTSKVGPVVSEGPSQTRRHHRTRHPASAEAEVSEGEPGQVAPSGLSRTRQKADKKEKAVVGTTSGVVGDTNEKVSTMLPDEPALHTNAVQVAESGKATTRHRDPRDNVRRDGVKVIPSAAAEERETVMHNADTSIASPLVWETRGVGSVTKDVSSPTNMKNNNNSVASRRNSATTYGTPTSAMEVSRGHVARTMRTNSSLSSNSAERKEGGMGLVSGEGARKRSDKRRAGLMSWLLGPK